MPGNALRKFPMWLHLCGGRPYLRRICPILCLRWWLLRLPRPSLADQVVVSGLEVRPLDERRSAGGATAALGTFVRGHESELRFCYEESLKADPALAGSVAVAITIGEGGRIAGAEVTRRSWTGQGAAEAEACMLRAIRGWRLSGVERSPGTYTFPFSFTR